MPLGQLNLLKAILFLVSFYSFHVAMAVATISATGASSSAQSTDAKGALENKIIINAGYALPANCVERSESSTCDSCVGTRIKDPTETATVPAPCNRKSIHDTLKLTIDVESDKSDFNSQNVGVASGTEYSGNQLTGFTVSTVNGRSYSVSATWAQVMSALGVTSFECSSATGCGSTKTFYIGPIKDDKFSETITVTVNYSIINYTSTAKPLNGYTKALAAMCKPKTVDPLVSDYSSNGLCFYEMYPGDEKAYITNLINGWKSTPTDPDTQLPYSNLIMYFREKASGSTSLATLTAIENNSSSATIAIKATEGDPLTSYKVENLENSSTDSVRTYCFLPALQDSVGNIIYFLDIQRLISTEQFSTEQMDKLCASPSEVVGVLSDKDCFIATVAFGSRYHPYLDILRKFRNKFLHPNSLGKKFIKFYYKNGPDWAKAIGDRPWVKGGVKVILLPVIGVAYLFLNPLWLLFVLMIGCFGFLGYRKWRV